MKKDAAYAASFAFPGLDLVHSAPDSEALFRIAESCKSAMETHALGGAQVRLSLPRSVEALQHHEEKRGESDKHGCSDLVGCCTCFIIQ
jgi:hypothetical protein